MTRRGKVILAIRTDKPQAELYLYANGKQLTAVKWQAHRQLANTLHVQLAKILDQSSIFWDDIQGIVCYQGPGSFTGLRIGLSVANALAYAQNVPIVARHGDDWIEKGIKDLLEGNPPAGGDKITVPYYNRPAATTPPKK